MPTRGGTTETARIFPELDILVNNLGVCEPKPYLLGIEDAYEHGLVFTWRDLDDLIATGKALQRPWSALVPYCPEFQAEFERTMKPDSWGGLAGAPFYLWCQNQLAAGGTK